MKLQKYLEHTNKRIVDLARDLSVRHCVARRWVVGEAIPNKDTMQKIYEWSGGVVEPNDFYGIAAANDNEIKNIIA